MRHPLATDADAQFLSSAPTATRLATLIDRLGREDAISCHLLDDAARLILLDEARQLPYRRARESIGGAERRVEQDFDLTVDFPDNSHAAALARALSDRLHQACLLLDPCPLAADFVLNDLIAQRYAAGSRGITAHRDHIRYRGLVAIVNLAGQARFFICRDRNATGEREIPMPEGSLSLMRAPGFAGRTDRPFHFLKDVREERISLGMRHDVHPGMPL